MRSGARRRSVELGDSMSAASVTSLEQARRDRRACERFVVEHLPAVRAVAGHYRGLNVPFDDLVQEGCIGLLEAISSFDPARGVDFETYSRFQVRCAIRDALTHTSRLVRLPKRVVERRRTIDRTEAELAASAGHIPSAVEIAGALELPLDVVVELQGAPCSWLSFESPLDQLLADEDAVDPARDAARHDELVRLDAALDALPGRQRELVVRRFGLGCPREELTEIASSLHISRQRARAIEQTALYALRDRLDPRANEGGRSCKRTFSSPTDPSTGRRARSRRRSRTHSARTASTRVSSLR
jgi:RNA polymerase sigma factor (sigma-70 family)